MAGKSAGTVRRLGAVGFWGGIAGALSALVVIVYPVVSPELFSYPFNATGFTIAQVFFAMQHLTMVAVIVALLLTPAVGLSRLAVQAFALASRVWLCWLSWSWRPSLPRTPFPGSRCTA